MPHEQIWQPLAEELNRWNHAGRTATFWLRDDDAVEPTAQLDRLLRLTGTFAIPTVLAVIPACTDEALADRLITEPHISVAVHGWSHENHAPADEKKQELGPHRLRQIILTELATALARMQQLHGQRLIPMLVPPWNRIDSGLLPDLGALGFETLSVYGPATPSPIRMLNSTIDLMDWHGTSGCHDHSLLVHGIVVQLQQAFEDGGDGVGLLTHHLVHDERAWTFLERLFETTLRHAACKWRSAGDIMAGSAA
ncbi:polysaccharide deacetylase [Pseudaminobacter arsenicus]|uniref:Polysaccharide deacetylase n=1 Tax=Borborobacter arsenicus TaxID=1851146 RepID=A0A432VA21_9HYPH|nr:polysaccharide deacetylase family protein [Pseudaminobacter arsenicus]RUM98943.1 polysaccharide deacetylase [Pseudaminobacter arsenicus]